MLTCILSTDGSSELVRQRVMGGLYLHTTDGPRGVLEGPGGSWSDPTAHQPLLGHQTLHTTHSDCWEGERRGGGGPTPDHEDLLFLKLLIFFLLFFLFFSFLFKKKKLLLFFFIW